MTKTEKKLNPKQELFCQYYVNNRESFANGTLAYALAYKIDLEEKGQYDVAKANAHRLLTNAYVSRRIIKLLNDFLNNDVVDAELAKVIIQDIELPSKMAAIREYNKLRQRVTDKVELITPEPIYGGKSTQKI